MPAERSTVLVKRTVVPSWPRTAPGSTPRTRPRASANRGGSKAMRLPAPEVGERRRRRMAAGREGHGLSSFPGSFEKASLIFPTTSASVVARGRGPAQSTSLAGAPSIARRRKRSRLRSTPRERSGLPSHPGGGGGLAPRLGEGEAEEGRGRLVGHEGAGDEAAAALGVKRGHGERAAGARRGRGQGEEVAVVRGHAGQGRVEGLLQLVQRRVLGVRRPGAQIDLDRCVAVHGHGDPAAAPQVDAVAEVGDAGEAGRPWLPSRGSRGGGGPAGRARRRGREPSRRSPSRPRRPWARRG